MSKNRLYLFLLLICSSLAVFAWNVGANRSFMALMLPQAQDPTPVATCQEPGFNFTKVINSNNASYIFTTDFNRDGKLDIGLASAPNQVTFFLGDGKGEVIGSKTISLGGSSLDRPVNILEADFNQDGSPDYLVAKESGITLLLNNGLGNLIASDITSQTSKVLSTADFNHDGKADFVSASGKDISLFFGDGTGKFSSAINSQSPINIEWLLVNDFNLDGSKDIVAVGENKVVTLLGNKQSSLSTAIITNTTVNPKYVQSGDFNQDGKLDLVVIDDNSPIFAQLLLNNSNGEFKVNEPINTTLSPSATKVNRNLVVGDFNQDGKIDFVLSNAANFDPLLDPSFARVFLGDGKGNISYGPLLGNGNARDLLVSADFNGDGKLDLIRASNGENNFEINLSGISAGCITPSFVPLPNLSTNSAPTRSVIADFNNDGKLDVITADTVASSISRLFGNDTGSLTAQVQIPLGAEPIDLANLDFNQDGNQDLVVANRLSNTITLLMGDGTGNFNFNSNVSLANEPVKIKTGDFNGDGKVDVIVANTSSLSILTNLDGKNLSLDLIENIKYLPNSLEVSDLNRDGNLDIIVGKSDGSDLTIFLGNGKGSFVSKNILSTCGLSPKINGVGDFNRDGFQDLLVNCNTGTNRVLLGDPTSQFTSAISLSQGLMSAFGDFNNDSNLDVLVYIGGNKFSLLLGDGIGNSKPIEFTSNFTLANALFNTGDFNQDGKLDFLVTDKNNNLVNVMLNTCQGSSSKLVEKGNFQTAAVSSAFSTPLQVTVLDVAGNGLSNVVVEFEAANLGLNAGGSFAGNANKVSVKTDSNGLAVAPVFTANNFAGDHIVTATVVNDAGIRLCGVTFNLTNTEGVTVLIIPSGGQLPDASSGVSYNFTFSASQGTPPYSFNVIQGSLPPGLTLSPSGMLTGIPAGPGGTFSFDVEAADSMSATASGSYTLNVNISTPICPPITIDPPTLPDGTVGMSYMQTLMASGGMPPYTFSIINGLFPPGLMLNPDGTIIGTPAVSGFFNFDVEAADGATDVCTGVMNYSINIAPMPCPPITLAPPTLPDAVVGMPYSQTITASGGTPPYFYSLLGKPPIELSIDPMTGVLSGTFSGPASFTITIAAQDSSIPPPPAKARPGIKQPLAAASGGCVGMQTYTLNVVCPPITITPPVLLPGTIGIPYSQMLGATGGTAPYFFAVASGGTGSMLPPGLNLDSGGSITGTPTASGTFLFDVQVFDSIGCFDHRFYAITITCPTITITPPSLPGTMVGAPYNQTLTASGGASPYTFSIVNGILPPGLNLDPTGNITGSATTAGTFTFTVQAMDTTGCSAMRNYSIAVCGTIIITPATLPGAGVGIPYSQTLTASGGNPPYNFSIITGTLPPGLSLSPSGNITGTPTSPGNFSFTVQALDTSACVAGMQTYTISVACPAIGITPPTLPNATIGMAYNQTLGAIGGTAPYTFLVASGGTGSTLPPGLNLSSSGNITGTPTNQGNFSFTVQAIDASGCTGALTYTINVACPTITITPPALPSATIGIPYSQTLGATGGTSPYTFAVASGTTTLPPGLTLSTTGILSGVPSTGGVFNFTVQAIDASGCTGFIGYSITAAACPSITITPPSLITGTQVGVPYSQTLGATGGTAPYTFALIPGTGSTLPPGLTLNSTGLISGTPSSAGSFLFNVQATDSIGCSTSRSYAIVILCPTITITPSALPSGTLGIAYSQTLSVTGGSAPYNFSLVGGGASFPPGLSFDSKSGLISGTPTALGTFPLIVQATDSTGCSVTNAYTITILANCSPFTFLPAALTSGTTGSAYNQVVNINGGTAPYSFTVSSGALPPGLSLQSNQSSVAILGTPLLPGTFNFTLQASDSLQCSGIQTYTIVIAQSCATITISPNTLPDAAVNSAYSQPLTASGGTAPYTFSISSGTLPDGITLSQAGVLSGTATAGGTFSFIVQAKDSNNCTSAKNYTLAINGTPGTIGFSASSFSVAEGSRVTITITRTGGTSGQVGVSFAAVNGSAVSGREFTSAQGTITFADGDMSPKTFTIQTTANNLVEPNKTFTVQLTNPTGGAKLGTASATVTITEKDVAQPGSLAFTQPSYTISEIGGAINITVVRLNGGNIPISVNYETNPGPNAVPGSNYVDVRGILNFTPGANMQSFSIPILNDNQPGLNKIVNIRLSNPTGGATISTGFATLTIQEVSSNPAQIKVDLQDIDFGSVNIGTLVKRTITVTNTGGQELNFTPTVSGNGVKLLSVANTRLLANQSTTFDMVFEALPGSLGNVTGLLNITSNGGNAAIKILGRSIDTIAPKMTFSSPNGGDIVPSGTSLKIRFDVIENDALSNTTVSFAALLADGKVLTGDIARLDGQSREVSWNIPLDLETSGTKIFLRSSDRAGNISTSPSSQFSVRRSISTAPVLETLLTFTPPPAGSMAAPSGLKADAKESSDGIFNQAPEPVLNVQINFQPPMAGQVAPPRNVTVKAGELNDKTFAQIAKVKFGPMPRAEADLVIAGYNVYRAPQNEDGSMPSADEIVKEENLITTLPSNSTGFNDKVSTSGSNNYVYSVSTFFGNGQMSGGSQPMGTNLPVIQNPTFEKGTVFLTVAGSLIKQGATLIINDNDTYTLQFDETGTRFTVSKKQASNGSSVTVKRLIGKTSIVKMVVKNPDGGTSVAVMFGRKGIVKTAVNNAKVNKIEPKADAPNIAGFNIYRVAQPVDGTMPKIEEIIKPENLIGSIPGNMNSFMDKASTSSSNNFVYSVSTFFGNGQMSSGSQPAATDLPVVKNPKFEDKNFFVDSAASFIKNGATLIIDDKEMYILGFDDSGTRFTPRKQPGSPSNLPIDQFIKKDSTVRLTIKNPDGKLSVGVMFTRGK